MGRTNPVREAVAARGTYLRALTRLNKAMDAVLDAQVPLSDKDPPTPWTREHVALMKEAAEAWPALVEARRIYDACRREAGGGLLRE